MLFQPGRHIRGADGRCTRQGDLSSVGIDEFCARTLPFSMNDEVVHTGFYPMAHYFFALCCGKKI